MRLSHVETQTTQTAAGTQEAVQAFIQPRPEFHRTEQRESSFQQLYPSLNPDAGRADDESDEPTTPDEVIDLTLGGARIEVLARERCSMRITFPETFFWIELQELEDGTYTIQAGQDRLKEKLRADQPLEYETVTADPIHDHQEFLTQVRDTTEDWLTTVLSLLITARNCAIGINDAMRQRDQQSLSQVSAADFAELTTKLNQALKEAKKYKTLYEKSKTATGEGASHHQLQDALEEMTAERDQLTAHVADYNNLKAKYGTECVRTAELERQVTTERTAYDTMKQKYEFEKNDADRMQDLYNKEYDKATQYYHDRTEKDAQYEDLLQQMQKKDADAKQLQQTLIRKIQRYEPTYSPFTILQNETHRGSSPANRSARSPTRDGTPLPTPGDFVPRLTRFEARVQDRREHAETPPPMGTRSERTREPYIPRSTPAASVAAATGIGFGQRIRMPDIDKFHGREDEDYDKWRQTVVNKCEYGYEEEGHRIAYLINFIKDDAWELVKDIKPISYHDFLEGLDEFYGSTSADKIAEAIEKLSDPSQPLKQKPGETFAAWRVRFVAVRNLVKLPDLTMIKYAQIFMNSVLANAATIKKQPGDNLFKYLQYAQEFDRERQTTSRPATTKPASSSSFKPTKRVTIVDPRTDTHGSSKRYTDKQIAYNRSEQEKDTLLKNKLCFKCGKPGHQQRSPTAPCKGKPFTPSNQIPALAAAVNMIDLDDGETEDEPEPEEPEVDDQGYYVEDDGDQDF